MNILVPVFDCEQYPTYCTTPNNVDVLNVHEYPIKELIVKVSTKDPVVNNKRTFICEYSYDDYQNQLSLIKQTFQSKNNVFTSNNKNLIIVVRINNEEHAFYRDTKTKKVLAIINMVKSMCLDYKTLSDISEWTKPMLDSIKSKILDNFLPEYKLFDKTLLNFVFELKHDECYSQNDYGLDQQCNLVLGYNSKSQQKIYLKEDPYAFYNSLISEI